MLTIWMLLALHRQNSRVHRRLDLSQRHFFSRGNTTSGMAGTSSIVHPRLRQVSAHLDNL